MTLNIKAPEAHRLARQLAELTGETMTRAVTQALRERLDRLTLTRATTLTVADLLAIGRRCSARIKGQPVDHGALLYDERGLPE